MSFWLNAVLGVALLLIFFQLYYEMKTNFKYELFKRKKQLVLYFLCTLTYVVVTAMFWYLDVMKVTTRHVIWPYNTNPTTRYDMCMKWKQNKTSELEWSFLRSAYVALYLLHAIDIFNAVIVVILKDKKDVL